MKVSDGMIAAAWTAFNAGGEDAMRLAIEAAINAYVKPTRSESAKARWEKTSAQDRHDHMMHATKAKMVKLGLWT